MNVLIRMAAMVAVVGLSSQPVRADEWHEVTIYTCDEVRNVLTLRHFGAYNDRGEALLRKHSGTENLHLPAAPSDTRGEDWRVLRRCKLGAGIVEIEMTPGHKLRVQGECGGWATDQIRISLDGRELFKSLLQRWCSSDEIISEIVVDGATSRVDVTKKSISDFYR